MAQAAAILTHQNIVPVYSVGHERGVHYYAMQYVEGQTLAEVIQELRSAQGAARNEAALPARSASKGPAIEDRIPDPKQRETEETAPLAALSTQWSDSPRDYFRTVAQLGIQAAEGLEHAHQLGVVHRDIKPANLLVDVRGNVWITDFGLAQLQGDPRLTVTGDLLGTLRYMSPEQALASRATVDHRTDVYSLGITLYELLTLEPAFPGSDRQELLRRIATDEPTALRRINPSVPPELETIVLKAIAKEPDGRYGAARELADDLQRFLDDKPIRARRPSILDRLRKWSRRHQFAILTATTATVLLALALSAGVLVHNRQLQASARREAQQAQAAQRGRQQAEANLYHALVREARALRLARGNGYRIQAWARLEEARRLPTAWLYGGAGDDRIKGGAGHDMIQGGSGEDLLVGGAGRDLMIGGAGADRIVGNADDDILIAGATAYDDLETALAAILGEWTSSRDYATRIANIKGTGTGPSFESRLNADFFLVTGGPQATVFDDGAKDVMTGSEGQDWFFANLDEGTLDKITDLNADEFAADIDWILAS